MHQALDELQLNFQQIEELHAEKVTKGNITIDPWLRPDSEDSRLGLSLIFPVGSQFKSYTSLCSHYMPFQDSLYLYPHEDLHVTLFDIFPSVVGFDIFDGQLNQYSKVIHELFQKIPPFQIDLKGVLFTDVGGFVKGFDCLNLHHIRKEIREKMTAAKLPFQERYESKIAHITFCRYKDELTHPYKLQQVNQKLREHYLDTLQITEVSLVIHDCYNLKSKTKIVASIPLGGKNKQFIVQRPIIITP